MNPILRTILSGLVALLTPALLMLTALRLLLTPVFVQAEYRMPYFPEDTYGFSQADRLELAPLALDYLLNDEGIDFLGELTFEDGTPLYNERELVHMVDVKDLVQVMLKVWWGLLAVFVGLGVWARRAGWWDSFRLMLSGGGKLTMVLIVAMVIYLAINFYQLFTYFHKIFFQGDSWLFKFSDTLIRLFPLQFWQDAFIAAGALTFLGAAALWYFFEKKMG